MKIVVFWLEFHWMCSQGSNQNANTGADNGMTPKRRQDIICTNDAYMRHSEPTIADRTSGIPLFITVVVKSTLQWRHNGRDGVSDYQPHDCLRNVYSGTDQRKHQSSASLAYVREIQPVNTPHKGPLTRKMFPFDDVIMHTDLVRFNKCMLTTESTRLKNPIINKTASNFSFEILQGQSCHHVDDNNLCACGTQSWQSLIGSTDQMLNQIVKINGSVWICHAKSNLKNPVIEYDLYLFWMTLKDFCGRSSNRKLHEPSKAQPINLLVIN